LWRLYKGTGEAADHNRTLVRVLPGATVDMHPSRNEDRVTPIVVHIFDVAAIQQSQIEWYSALTSTVAIRA